MDRIAFAAAALSLLATPGPTNTLLATSGAKVGLRRSLPLLGAELGGYLLAILLLRALIGPLMAANPVFAAASISFISPGRSGAEARARQALAMRSLSRVCS